MLDGDNDDFTPPLFDDPNPNPYEYTIEQILHFKERYQNGFDVFIDDDYVRWLSIEHPEALPAHLRTFEENPLPVTKPSEVTVHGDDSEPTYTDGSEVDSHDNNVFIAGTLIALELKGYTPVFLNPAINVSGFIALNQASLKRGENWNLVTT